MDIALPVAAVRFFDGLHAVVGAHAVPHETLKPVERIDDNRAVVVLLVAHRLKLENDVVEALPSGNFEQSISESPSSVWTNTGFGTSAANVLFPMPSEP